MAAERGEWAGIPMLLDGERLIVEPTYPKADKLMAYGAAPDEPGPPVVVRNSFWSARHMSDIHIFEHDGKIRWGLSPGVNHFRYDLRTLGCMDAWGIEQESNAVQLLGTLVRHRQLKQYLLTGMFLERSSRSGLMYMFRRLRPTVVMTMSGPEARILCTLCLHPIAFYAGSWAGAMCPTDDVVAHLMLMRGDEPMLWRRANQHAAYRPESGL